MGEVGIDISKQVAHYCWHTGTHVFGRQTGEMPAEENKQLLFALGFENKGQCCSIFGGKKGKSSPPRVNR